MAAPALELTTEAEQLALLDAAAARTRAAAVERDVFREVFRPRVRKNLLEWSEERRYLSPEANALAAEAGGPVRYSSALTPYHRDIMLALSDPRTEIVACMLPSQDGKTELLNNFVGWRIDLEPGPMLVMQPTGQMAEAWSKDRLAPMLRDTPELRGKVRDARSRDADNTILHKKFPGGHLTAVGSNSPAGLASRPIRDVLVDEVDRCAVSAGSEGDSIRLAFRRAQTFRRGKKLLISSPTIKGRSRIHKEYLLGTQEVFEVPCPHCGEYQPLVWGGKATTYGLRWTDDDPDSAHYVCVQGCVIEEHEKAGMMARYRWTAQNPSAGPRRRSFWKNAIGSLLVSWRKLVAEWLEIVQGGETKREELQTFVNTVMCELFDPIEGEEVSAEGLLARLGVGYPEDNETEPGTVPAGVALLTRSVDVQGDRLETAVWGWGAGEEAWLIDYELLDGDPATPVPWRKLDVSRGKKYRHASGTLLAPRVTFIDRGGHHAKEVYGYTRTRQAQNVFAIYGANTEGAPLLGRPTRPDSAKSILFPVGSFTAKLTLMKRLTKITEPGPGFIHLPAWLDGEQVAQFTREKLISRVAKGGKRLKVWEQTGRNEQIDLYAYALAALHKLGHNVVRALGAIARRLEEEGAQRRAAPAPDPAAARRAATVPARGGFVRRY